MSRRKSIEHIAGRQRDPAVRDELSRNLRGHGSHSLVSWLQRGRMIAEQRRVLQEALSDDEVTVKPRHVLTKPGDMRQLRGLPVVGVPGGMGGAIAGSRPTDAIRKIDRERSLSDLEKLPEKGLRERSSGDEP